MTDNSEESLLRSARKNDKNQLPWDKSEHNDDKKKNKADN